jgi:hypothetical protein
MDGWKIKIKRSGGRRAGNGEKGEGGRQRNPSTAYKNGGITTNKQKIQTSAYANTDSMKLAAPFASLIVVLILLASPLAAGKVDAGGG